MKCLWFKCRFLGSVSKLKGSESWRWCWGTRVLFGGQQRMRWLDSITDYEFGEWHEFGQTLGDSEGQGRLASCSLWVAKSQTWLSHWTTTVQLSMGLSRWLGRKEPTCQCRRHKRLRFDPESGRSAGEGNSNPLQYSCLGNPMNRGASWAIIHGVAKSRTKLGDWAHTQASCYLTWSSPLLSEAGRTTSF